MSISERLNFAPACGSSSFEPFQHAELVTLSLQSSQEPSAGVGESLVVEVHGVLRGEDDTQTERAGLLEQCEHRPFAGRVGRRREVAEDLVHVEYRPQAARAGLRADPVQHFVEQDRDKEHPLGVVQMSDRQDRQPGPLLGSIKQRLDVERFALQPICKRGRRQQIIDLHPQLQAILGRQKAFQVDNSHLRKRRLLDVVDQAGQIEIATGPPGRSSTLEIKIASRLCTGSASIPTSASTPWVVDCSRSL